MSEPKLSTTDFTFDDVIPLRPVLIKRMGGDIEGAAVVARIQYRCRVQRPDADGFRWWRTSAAELAEEVGISLDRAKRKLKSLVDDEWVLCKVDNDDPWDRTKSYRPHDDSVSAGDAHCADLHNASGDSAQCKVQIRTMQGADLHNPLSTKEALKNLRTNGQTPPAPAEPDPFPEWWKLYPKKVKKDAGEKAYRRALKKATAQELLDGLRRYVAWLGADPDPRYIAHPTTWLNEGRWSDELQANKPGTSGAYVERNGVMLTRKNAEALDMLQQMRQQNPQQQLALDPGARARELEGAPW